MRYGDLPPGPVYERTTGEFSAESTPRGLLRAHRLAPGIWGLLEVTAGSVTFVWEAEGQRRIILFAEDSLVIEPELPHHVEPDAEARFAVGFYR